MIGFFRKTPASIVGHEKRLAELSTQINDAEKDLADAETRARDCVLDGGDLDVVTTEIVKTSATISALRAGQAQLESELADLRAKAEEVALSAKIDAAQARVEAWRQQANDLSDKITPLLAETEEMIGGVNQVYGYLISPVPGEAREHMRSSLWALQHTVNNCDAVTAFLAQRNEDAADRVLAI